MLLYIVNHKNVRRSAVALAENNIDFDVGGVTHTFACKLEVQRRPKIQLARIKSETFSMRG